MKSLCFTKSICISNNKFAFLNQFNKSFIVHKTIQLLNNNVWQSQKKKQILLLCWIVGLAVRLLYCIYYPVQPRDVFEYESVILEWEANGTVGEQIDYFPLSIWILKIPYHYLGYNIIKGGVIVNILLGLCMNSILLESIGKYVKRTSVLLIIGLSLATNPTLVHLSCSMLRENSYLMFLSLTVASLIHYIKASCTKDVLRISVFSILAFLCRLEGAELVLIFFFVLVDRMISGKIKIKKAIYHSTVFVSVAFFVLVITLYSMKYDITYLKRLLLNFS